MLLKKKFVIILPFFNENELIIEFIKLINNNLKNLDANFLLLFVNDGSTDNTQSLISSYKGLNYNIEIQTIELKTNSGHQNAIRQGLIYVKNKYLELIDGVIIMDSDGEDNPEAISELITIKEFEIVFVTRGKRKESLLFKLSYFIYKLIFRTITGKQINFGNYSMINTKVLSSIADKNFFHYSASLSKQNFTIKKIKYNRNKRLSGSSKMNYKGLMIHGLKSFIEYNEELIYFQVKVFSILLVFFLSLLSYVFYSKFISNTAFIGWSSTLLVNLINGMLIIFSSIILSTLLYTIKNTLEQKNIIVKKNFINNTHLKESMFNENEQL